MKLPKIITFKAVDWVEYKKYLEKEYPTEWAKYDEPLWRWFCTTSDFSNGCFVTMEKSKVMGYGKDHPATWFADCLYRDYGKTSVVGRFGDIQVWVWW